MNRLIFKLKNKSDPKNKDEFAVLNKKGDYLGSIAYWKVGRKMDWWFFVEWHPMDGSRDFWLGEDCLREIADKLKELKNGG